LIKFLERMNKHYDVIVIGGGHAGIEAAWAAATLGAHTAMITFQRDAIGRMSCNPAIGGLGKGHIVREIDALGGLMGLATDRAGIQFRLLNRSKGPAVWAPRAQCDRDAYPAVIQSLLAQARSLDVIEGSVETIETREDSIRPRVTGVTLADGRRFTTEAVIVTTGTFLRGLMHCGENQSQGGRIGEQSATGLSATLLTLGFELGRLKTGTPPRIHRDTIHYDACEVQPGDDQPVPFSDMTDALPQPQVPCWITWTNAAVHEHIHANLHRAPMYSGQIQSQGPRYCPSIEDKVVRFSDKPKHQVFLEPEGYDNERVYCNGISTSLPRDVQDAMVREIPGLRDARILQHGYAVEYDYVPTHQTRSTLETKLVDGLFLAGQINGTSGYEEAAGQGLIAGINAVRAVASSSGASTNNCADQREVQAPARAESAQAKACGSGVWEGQGLRWEGEAPAEPFILRRDQAYIGVMIDDLITRPPTEPYRMFTSRAEYRLQLRADNADLRLTPLGREIGLVDDARWSRFTRLRETMARIEKLMGRGHVEGTPLGVWLRRPDAEMADFADALARCSDNGRTFCTDVLWRVMTETRYQGYVERQARQIDRFRKLESMQIPDEVDYRAMRELRAEARECLTRVHPRTLGQAGRISGINQSDLMVVWIYLTGRRRVESATAASS
jgi:tRNA uridine 5-carboxymethylaminomethyl modification enzyme